MEQVQLGSVGRDKSHRPRGEFIADQSLIDRQKNPRRLLYGRPAINWAASLMDPAARRQVNQVSRLRRPDASG